MGKESFYFSHDYNAANDPKCQALIGEYKAEGYGVYWYIIELLHQEELHKLPMKEYMYLAIAKQMQASAEQIEAIVKYCILVCDLLVVDGDFFYSKRVMSNFKKRSEISKLRSEAGKKGAIAKQILANAKQNLAKPSKEKKIKEKEIKDNNYFNVFWDLYPKKKSKGDAEKAWNKIKSPSTVLEQIKKSLEWQRQSNDWIKDNGQFIPYPATYLNQRRWEDEKESAQQQSLFKREEYPEHTIIVARVTTKLGNDFDGMPDQMAKKAWKELYDRHCR